MVPGKDTNTVYLTERLRTDERYCKAHDRLTGILEKHSVQVKYLRDSKIRDIWCRDFMPVQIGQGRFVQFRYEPSYLVGYEAHRTNPEEVSEARQCQPVLSDINLDGGNIVNCFDRAIVTDRIFDENPGFTSKTKLVSAIEKLLEAEVIVIPQINSDLTGHADGMVRFVGRDTLLGNHRDHEYKYWTKGINRVLKAYGIQYIDIPFGYYHIKGHSDHAIGCYVNYLEVGNLMVVPIFGYEPVKDEAVVKLFHEIFPDRIIESVNYNEVGLEGGLLNCSTWTIKEES